MAEPTKRSIFLLLTLLCLPAAAFGGAADQLRVMLSPSLHPATEAAFVPSPDELPDVAIDPAWYVRTGARKGLSGRADTGTELLVAPDTAVLSRGLSAAWPSLLAGVQEAAAPAAPQDVAGLNAGKKLLIIPSGALAGTNQSGFFKAGLAEYVWNGGTVFCLSQRRGVDLSALPVPEGQRLEAVGWSEDSGPLFRVSMVRADHPLLKNLAKPAPLVETDGYIRTYPAGARVLLARPDGFPTLLAYAYGKGQVVVSTVFTDLSSLLGAPERDEKTLLRNLLSWSKSKRRAVRAGKKITKTPKKRVSGILPPGPPLPAVRAAVTRSAGRLTVVIELPGSAQLKGRQVFVRSGGREKRATLAKGATRVSFQGPFAGNERRISYAVYARQGRCLTRGSLAVPSESDGQALPARPFYRPGELASFEFNGIGKGQVTLEGLGYMNDQIIPDRGAIRMEVPDDLPAGTYRILWLFEDIGNRKKDSSFPLDVAGYRVAVEDAVVSTRDSTGKLTGRVVFAIRTDRKISGTMHLTLRRPDSTTVRAAEPVVSLVEGTQSIPIDFPLGQDLSGTWELSYRFSASLPVGPALPQTPVDLEAGSLLFDRGDEAVLALSTQPLLQYEPGPAALTAILLSKGTTTVQVSVDGRELSREQKELSGAAAEYSVPLPKLGAGTHRIRVSLIGQGPAASREYRMISGLRLPDLTIRLAAGEPRAGATGPVLPLTVALGNEGKSASGPVRLALSEGDPAGDGALITTIEVPGLAPGEKAVRLYEWPLYQNAGAHTLRASINDDARIEEADRDNNLASLSLTVPDLLLLAPPPKTGFPVGDPISLPLTLFNLTGKPYQGLALRSTFSNRSGKTVSSESLPVPEIQPAASVSLEQRLGLAVPLPGTYTLSATASAGTDRAAASVRFTVLPTLLFTGTLNNTPANAVQCRPFTFRSGIRSSGNILHTSGTVRLQVLGKDQAEPLLVRTFPLAVGERSVTIDSLDLPVGTFTLRLTASAANDQFKVSREFTLAERELTVSGPIEAKRVESVFPRILILRGRDGRLVEQAVAETMLQQAFDREDIFARTVESEEEFMAQAMTGLYSVYVLFEPEEQVRTAWLKERIRQGQGVVIIGSGAVPRAMAEGLGFTFRELPAGKTNTTITFSDGSPLVVSGTVPASGKGLQVRKAGARTAAFFGSPDEPAMLIDAENKGKVIVLPLSLSRSAYEDGTASLYSLVLRKAGLFAAPEGESGGPLSGGISIAARGGAVESRVVVTLPGSKVVWSNLQSTVSGSTITYELTADREPQKLLYLYQPGAGGQHTRSAEVFHRCGGAYRSQGRIE